MKYEIHQIRLSEQLQNEVNRIGHSAAAADHSIYRAHLDTTRGKWDPGYLTLYTKVATVLSENTLTLEDVFRIGNIGPRDDSEILEQHGPMHSLSVGDLVRDQDGVWHLCASMGWEVVFMENTPYWVAA
jgi:hypothetical protein